MQTSLEVCSEKIEDIEVSSELKDEDLKSKSELEPEILLADSGVMMESSEEGSGESEIHLVEKSDKIMDVKDVKGEAVLYIHHTLFQFIDMKFLII